MNRDLFAYIEPFEASKLPGPKSADPLHRLALESAVSGADAYRLTRAAVRVEGATARLGNRFVPLDRYREIAFVAVGRAAGSQALAVFHALDQRVTQGFAVAPEELPGEIPFRHRALPVTTLGQPEAAESGAAVAELAQGLGPKDLLLVLLSAGALGYLAAPPAGVGAEAWAAELGELATAGLSGEEVAAIARIEASGPVGGRLADGVTADVVTLVVDNGSGAARIGGGPTVPVTSEEQTEARAALERVGAWGRRSPARQSAFLASPTLAARRLDRPVVVAEPADALREASAAVGEKRWRPRLGSLRNTSPPERAASEFLARVEELRAEAERDSSYADALGLVVVSLLSLDLAEGTDEGPAIDRFLQAAGSQLRRREMTLSAARTSGALPGEKRPAGGVVVAAAGAGGPTNARALAMRAGITDVGVLATAVVARSRPE